jgi:meiotically up-regulated gene 157 (Mug157) protein
MSILIVNSAKAQKEIRDGIYLYGKLANSVKGNILIAYKIDDAESEAIILDKLESSELTLFSYHDYFLPGVHYEESELDSFIKFKSIETIIYVSMRDISSHEQINMSSFYLDIMNTNFTVGNKTKVFDKLTLVFEIHAKADNFKRPIGILRATGGNGSFQGTLYKTVKKVVKVLEEEGAFGGEVKEVKEREVDGMQDYINKRR